MRLPHSASSKYSGASHSSRGTIDDKPIVIKPPAMVRQNYLRNLPKTDGRPKEPSFSDRLARSIQQQRKSLRSGNIRNPKDPLVGRPPPKFKKSSGNSVSFSSKAEDEEFYSALREQVAQTSKTPPTDSSMDTDYTKLLNLSDDARETKTILLEWKEKIKRLEENLKDQDGAMQEVLKQNEELETQVAKLSRKEKVDQQLSVGLPGVPSMPQLVEENKELEMEVERLKRNLLIHAVGGDVAGQEVMAERNKLIKQKKQLEKALSAAKEENARLVEEASLHTKETGSRSASEGQALLERNKTQRKEAQLERSLAAAESENKALLEEVRRHNLEIEKTERFREKQEEELRTLRSELEMNRRIVHTKRNLLQKEITEEFKEETRNELEERITLELTSKISEEVGARMKAEKEKDLIDLRHDDEERVRNVECQIPILENEIDRLRKELSDTKKDHERAITSIRERHQDKLESIVENFSDDRKREGSDFSKRIEALSAELRESKENAATEKAECESRVRKEVTAEMQKEIQFLAVRVTELTKELIEVVEKMNREKESFGESIHNELMKERDEILEQAAIEKELYAAKVREETIEERDEAISKIMTELEEVTMERESLLAQVKEETEDMKMSDELRKELEDCRLEAREVENERGLLKQKLDELGTELQLTKERSAKDVAELETLRIELDLSKTEMTKLKNQRDELIVMAEEFKNDCISMSKEMQKIKGHFKFAVLVEYEEKIIELENELHRLETVVAASEEFNADDMKKLSEQSLQLEQYQSKEKEMETKIKRLTEAVLSSVSELELKEQRLTDLKDILHKKEIEASKLDESAKNIQRHLSASESELERLRKEQEISKQKILSVQVYKEQIHSLTEELADYKSRQEQENSSQQKEYMLMKEKIESISEMLRISQLSQQKERSSFAETKETLDKNLLASENEIRALHSEVSRLRNLLDVSRKSAMREGWQDGQTPRIKNSRQNSELSKQNKLLEFQQKELLHNIAAAERAKHDLKRHQSESETTLRNLKGELRFRDEEKRKLEKELHDNKMLLKEAVMSWRVETRSLKKQLDQLKNSQRLAPLHDRTIAQNVVDGDSELLTEESFRETNNEKKDMGKGENAADKGNISLPLPFVINKVENDDWPKNENSISKHDSDIRDEGEEEIEHSTMDSEKHTDIEGREDGSKSRAGNKGFTKMLDISEHTTSIEMKFDLKTGDDQSVSELSEGEKRERDNAEAIYNSLQQFKKEFRQYATKNDFADKANNSFPTRNDPNVFGSKNKISNLSRAPQPHLDSSSNDDEDQRSASMSRRSNLIWEEETRDDNSFSGSKHSFLPKQSRLLATESDDASSKDVSERTTATERSRALRKKMSDLLEIKNNIKIRSSANVAADTNNLAGRVAKQQLQEGTETSKSTPGAPWGLAPDDHPKLYKFLESKSPSKIHRRGSAAISKVPTDEHLERRDVTLVSLPSDEHSKRNWNQYNDAPLANSTAPTHE